MEKLLVGLDIGTNSVGWCATDENGKIIRKNGKRLWGFLGFDEASDAKQRRLHRCQRRRIRRRRRRIELLRAIFADEMAKSDDSFFYRLDHSFYAKDDRYDDSGEPKEFRYTVFNDRDYTDKDYYRQFPTIFHLRKHLIESEGKADIRHLYLALHHMIKYRGNFLNDSKEFKVFDRNEIMGHFRRMNECLDQLTSSDEDGIRFARLEYDDGKFEDLKSCAQGKSGIMRMREGFSSILNPGKNKFNSDVLLPLIAGGEVSVGKKIFAGSESDADPELFAKKICARSEEYEIVVDALSSSGMIDDSMREILMICKAIHDYFLVGRLIGDDKLLSAAMVRRFEEHRRQLRELKDWVKKNRPEKFRLLFKIDLDDKGRPKSAISNYPAFIGFNDTDGKRLRFGHLASKDDFYKFLKKELSLETNGDEFSKRVLTLMESGDYLERQNSSDNGVFPYQLHKMEMRMILERQARHYPFLNEVSEGVSNADKIISLLEFRIPYYVGPLAPEGEDGEKRKFAWAVRKESGEVMPWNFSQKIDEAQSAKNFIQRMLTKCAYLRDCYCLPKNSLLFSYYNCLNNLNKLLVNGRYITREEKMDLIGNLFKKKRKVSKKEMRDYFQRPGEKVTLTFKGGVDSFEERFDINFNMASYCDFAKIFGEDFDKDERKRELVENIIRDIVIFEEKALLDKRLRSQYNITDENAIRKIKALNYKGYGALSAEFLSVLKSKEILNEGTGEMVSKSIIRIMEETNLNLMEVLNDSRFGFMDKITEWNLDNGIALCETIEDYVGNLGFVSPIMKRPLVQAWKICEEIERIAGHRIDEYYVECARTNKATKGKKGMKSSRQEATLALLREARNTRRELMSLAPDIDIDKMIGKASSIDPNSFRSDKIHLYFAQLGKCMYTGNPIAFEDLMDGSKYDIDHIYPQSMVKDDSLSNRVLVEAASNREKSDHYPISRNMLWRGKGGTMAAERYFKYLEKCGLMSSEKLKRLLKTELSETDMESFVNRQLVTTNQAVKCFVNAVKDMRSDEDFKPKVVYSKAEVVSDFRKKFDIPKSRNVNNFHHAHDAYLNIIVGRAVDVYFDHFRRIYSKENWHKQMHDDGHATNVMRIFDPNGKRETMVTREGYSVWSFDRSIQDIKDNILKRFDIFSTERTFTKNELFGKVTVYPKGMGNIPVKASGPLSDTSKYGGLLQYSFSHYCLLRIRGKKGDEYVIESIPTAFKDDLAGWLDRDDICGKGKYDILIPLLKVNTVLESGDRKYSITGKSGAMYWIKNRKERHFSLDQIRIVKKCEKLYDMIEGKVTGTESREDIAKRFTFKDAQTIILSPAANARAEEITLSESELTAMYDSFTDLLARPAYSFSQCGKMREKLIERRDRFNELSFYGKCVLVMNLLDFLKCNERKSIDLTLIGGGKNECLLSVSKKLTDCRIVFESITGFYRKTVFEIENGTVKSAPSLS